MHYTIYRSIFEVFNFRGFCESRPKHQDCALELICECQELLLQQ